MLVQEIRELGLQNEMLMGTIAEQTEADQQAVTMLLTSTSVCSVMFAMSVSYCS